MFNFHYKINCCQSSSYQIAYAVNNEGFYGTHHSTKELYIQGLRGRSQEFANGGTSRRSDGRNSSARSSGSGSVGGLEAKFPATGDKCTCRLRKKAKYRGTLCNFSLLLPVY